ncbi:MAG: alpha/beta fold hydrolase, partial [Candidatus Hodarchaeota archaeon]
MSRKSIYRSSEGKNVLLNVYDKQLSKLNRKFVDIYVQTRYGKTHIVNIGRKNSIPLICLHGGNSNTPDMLISNLPMLQNFNIYSIDIIGHPGKSDETRLSSDDLSYGFWLLDVIDELQFETVNVYT